MKLSPTLSGAAVATAAAMLLLTAPVASAGKTQHSRTGHCMGVNACKGHSSCKTASNVCKGQNSCKGQGFVAMTKDQCDQVGGTFEAIK